MKKLLLSLAVCALVSLTGCESKTTTKATSRPVAPIEPTHNGGSSVSGTPTAYTSPALPPMTTHPSSTGHTGSTRR